MVSDMGISGIGGYLPLLRLDRAAAAKALRFSGLGGRQAGYRSVAGWDEDPVTMAVEAARRLTPDSVVTSLIFASTSSPFLDRSHATLIAEALAIPASIRTQDVAGSRRCGISALLDAMLGNRSCVIAAAEKRPAKPGNPTHLGWGDGSAAVAVEDGGPVRLLGHASISHDFLDLFRSAKRPEAYAAEERFIKEAATAKIIVPTIKAALEAAGVPASDIAHAVVHEPLPNMWRGIAKSTQITAPNYSEALFAAAGDLGCAHGMYALGLALDAANPGDKLLLVGFGSGCDALVLDVNGSVSGTAEMASALQQGVATADYVRFLSLTDTIELDWGARSEFEQKAQATVQDRYGRDIMGFVGGRDSLGNVQFPKSTMPVNPALSSPETLEDVRLADVPAQIMSITADRLNFTPDPPFDFGLVQFENGARVLMEMTDRPSNGFAVGDAVRMRMRVKSYNQRLGSRTYFWKAAPLERPAREDQ
jgi:hydroxymethylglutaryl-CoA synthase